MYDANWDQTKKPEVSGDTSILKLQLKQFSLLTPIYSSSVFCKTAVQPGYFMEFGIFFRRKETIERLFLSNCPYIYIAGVTHRDSKGHSNVEGAVSRWLALPTDRSFEME
jgi:hypothetical protein